MVTKELRILMLEDVEEEAGLIERVLRKDNMKFIFRRVDSAKEFNDAIDTFGPDVVLSDHALPQFNSIEALKLCRHRKLQIPFILVTGTVSEEFAVNCLKQGVDDYILKSNLSRLPSAIKNALKQHKLESERLLSELKLRDQNEELVKTNEELVKTNKELDRFVYSVSHNIRAPLMSVLGLIHIARFDKTRESNVDVLDMMERSVNRLDETLKEILEYSRNSRLETVPALVNFQELFAECDQRLSYLPNSNKVERKVTVHQGAPVRSDPYRLSIILQNLISNSIKYQDPNKSARFMQIRFSSDDGQIRIEFSDNGIGIAPEHLPRVFDMFHRATTRGEGAGLGLYITHEAVIKLGGSITVESQLGHGTSFDIRLPAS